jgi:uncharacterized protein YbjT (DUF2867 family)
MVLVTGATGFVGSHVVDRLAGDGKAVRALVRREADAERFAREGLSTVLGDVTDPGSLSAAVSGCDSVVHLVGIIREKPPKVAFDTVVTQGTQNLVKACRATGVGRLVYMSAIGARQSAPTKYLKTKWEAEQAIKKSGIPFTIFRSSVVVGPRGEFTQLLFDLARKPLVPIIGSGDYRFQPIFSGDVAAYISKSLDSEEAAGKTFEIAGPEVLTMNEMMRIASEVLGRTKRAIHVPLFLMRSLVPLMERVTSKPPITSDELAMMVEGSVAEDDSVHKFFPFELTGFADALAAALP